jgi:hypothetical protein
VILDPAKTLDVDDECNKPKLRDCNGSFLCALSELDEDGRLPVGASNVMPLDNGRWELMIHDNTNAAVFLAASQPLACPVA